jgi:hypothetical protein
MVAEGRNLAKFKELIGHENVKTTMKYLHPRYRWVCCCRRTEESLEVAAPTEGNSLNRHV